MVKALVENQPKQLVSDIEARLPSPSYSLHSIRALKSEYGREHTWYFLIGADNWAIFPSWYQYQDVMTEVTLVVFPRNGYPVSVLPKGVQNLEMATMEIGSTQIRQALAATHDFTLAKVPMEIRAYIQLNRLYGIDSQP
jgi:nicotinate-nucleotide adenylyltransferase